MPLECSLQQCRLTMYLNLMLQFSLRTLSTQEAVKIFCSTLASLDVLVFLETFLPKMKDRIKHHHPLQKFLSSLRRKAKVVLQNFGTKSISQPLKYLALVPADKILSKTELS